MRLVAVWFALDVVLVVLFAAAGRQSHNEVATIVGIADTAWPFLLGLLVGWVITRQWQTTTTGLPIVFQVWPAAIMLAFVTWAFALAIRVLAGDTNSGGFPFVALGFLLLMLVGWRIVWGSVVRVRAQRSNDMRD
ncbi:DUF3054 domain-containing protein [Jonesia denitrificans]|uniref:DUF3054 domain-containing protein n=1 Tax=Jonesia denitrificans TaxID=43674 RepID=UPI0002EA52E7|nr:DUF3054 domain-containing protein [Jonesia denitrificans]QXB42431.1 DUF3054 domain-containing protein [Jonesia denitrificans]